MKSHLRIDTIKVHPEDDRVLKLIRLQHDLPGNLWKSQAYRLALKTYEQNYQIIAAMHSLSEQVKTQNERLDELYFIAQQKS